MGQRFSRGPVVQFAPAVSPARLLRTAGHGLGLAVAAQSVPAQARSLPRRVCDAHRRGALRVTRSVVVYGVKRPDPGYAGRVEIVHHACRRPAGSGVILGIRGPDLSVYRSDHTMEQLQIAGTYVAVQSSSGEDATDECTKYGDSRTFPGPNYWVSVIDAQSRRRIDLPRHPLDPDDGDAAATSLSAQGAVAWLDAQGPPNLYTLEATAINPAGRSSFASSVATIDAGAIASGSLRFLGRTLHWVRDGHAHVQTLK
jgi:hypothetical protein